MSGGHPLTLILCSSLIKTLKSSILASIKILSNFFSNIEILKFGEAKISFRNNHFVFVFHCVCVFVSYVDTDHCYLLLDKDFYFVC